MASSICVTCHTPASARCISCHKPVCDAHVVTSGGKPFCSSACGENYAKFYAKHPDTRGSGFFARLIKLAVALAILGAIAVVVGAKVLKLGVCIELLKKVGL